MSEEFVHLDKEPNEQINSNENVVEQNDSSENVVEKNDSSENVVEKNDSSENVVEKNNSSENVVENAVEQNDSSENKVEQLNSESTEQLGKFFTSFLSQNCEIKENNDIISSLLGGILRNLIKNNVDDQNKSENEHSDSEHSEDESEHSEDESEHSEDEDEHSEDESEHSETSEKSKNDSEESESDTYTEMFIILENKKSYNYATSYPRARRTMLARFHRFLEKNSSNYMRIEKESERIVVYERQPNTLSPYDEQLFYQIEFFSVEKYTE
jgi:hypothetical protein